MTDDAELLRRYARDRAEQAFAEFVRRHIGLVYSAALRRTGNSAHAADAAQRVFLTAARQAGALSRHARLSGWLYSATRNAALNLMRDEQLRRQREGEAQAAQELLIEPTSVANWELLRPLLDDALEALGHGDREAVLVRFFEGQPLAEVGRRLGLSENAARMRVERALEKLRRLLARRGLTSTGAALGLALEAHAASSVPVGLVSAVAAQAVAGGAAATGLAAVAPAVGFMSATKWTAGVAAMALLGAGLIVSRPSVDVAPDLTSGTQRLAALRRERDQTRDRALTAEKNRDSLQAQIAAARSARAVASAEAAVEAAAAKPPPPIDPFAAADAFMKKHPEVRAALDEYGRARVNFRFGELYARLGLTPEQITRFQQLAAQGGFGTSSADGGELQFIMRPIGEWEANQEQLQALLGDEGMKLYNEIDVNDPLRTLTVRIAGGLWATEPLTLAQCDRLQDLFMRNPKRMGSNTISGVDWDLVTEQAREFLSPAQMTVLASERISDQMQRPRTVVTPKAGEVAP